jgi:hypothetical protein
MHEGLQAALDVEGGGGRVDPPCGHKGERGKGPKSYQNEDKPSKEGTEGMLPKRGLGGNVWGCGHISE